MLCMYARLLVLGSNENIDITTDGAFSQLKDMVSSIYPPKDKAEGAIGFPHPLTF